MEGRDTLTLVPPVRLGQLLVEHRTRSGLTVAEIAERSVVLPDASTVVDIEAGRVRLTDDQLRTVADAYGVDLNGLAPQRSELVVDVDSRALSIGEHVVNFAGPSSTMSDEVLSQYLSLVRALRSLPSDAEVILRDRDMGALSTALILPSDAVYERLYELMSRRPLDLRDKARRLLGRPLIPSLGILVGVTSVGSLILISQTTPTTPSAADQTAVAGITIEAPEAPPSASSSRLLLPGFAVAPTTNATTASGSTSAVAPSADAADVALDSPALAPTTIVQPASVSITPTERVVEAEPASTSTTLPPTTVAPPVEVVVPDAVAPDKLEVATVEAPTVTEIREQALALIAYPWQEKLPGWTIDIAPARDGYLGATYTLEQRIEIYFRPGQTAEEVAFTTAHEIGHAVDLMYNTPEDRRRWLEARGLAADHPWFTGYGRSDFQVGSGDFAESFALWQLGSGSHQLKLGGPPSAAQLNLLAELSFG